MQSSDFIKTASAGFRAMADLLDEFSSLSEKYDFTSILKEAPVVQTELFEKKEEPDSTEKSTQIEFVDLKAAATNKVRSGYSHVLKTLCSKYGVTKLSEIKKESYNSFLADMDEYCRDISKEEIKGASDHVLEARDQKYLTELLSYYSASSTDDLNPDCYAGFLWDSRRVK